MRDINATLPDTPFWRTYNGTFAGLPTWPGFDAFWVRFEASGGDWFVFDPMQDAPASPSADFTAALARARACVEQVRNRGFCGAVFADDLEAPSFVKVFDPYRMGGVCGGSGDRVLPAWIFSRLPPDPLPLLAPAPEKKGFFARLVG